MAATEQDTQQRTQAIQRTQREPVPFSPSNFDDGWRQAQALARSPLIPSGLKAGSHEETTANVMMVLMWGRELGVSPVQSLYNIHIIKGRPAVAAALKVGLVKQSPECLYFQCIESTAERAVWETHRRGNAKPTRIPFTADDARKAGLLGRPTRSGEDDNWTKWTATMLRWRAGAMLADAEYPDVTRGLGTTDDAQPQEVHTLSAIPETRPVEVLPPALPEPQPTPALERAQEPEAVRVKTVPRMTLEEAFNAPPGSFPGGEAIITDLPREERGDDMPVDPEEAEAIAIIEASEVETLTRAELDGLIARGQALPEGEPKKQVSTALKAAARRLKGGGK